MHDRIAFEANELNFLTIKFSHVRAVKLQTVNSGGINLKIDNSIKPAALPADVSSTKAGQKVGAPAPTSADTTIQLSSQLQNLEKSLSTDEVFDAARVEKIKQAISEGRFVVNPEKVADQLLDTVRDLIKGRH